LRNDEIYEEEAELMANEAGGCKDDGDREELGPEGVERLNSDHRTYVYDADEAGGYEDDGDREELGIEGAAQLPCEMRDIGVVEDQDLGGILNDMKLFVCGCWECEVGRTAYNYMSVLQCGLKFSINLN
jgi:hypothetical protein